MTKVLSFQQKLQYLLLFLSHTHKFGINRKRTLICIPCKRIWGIWASIASTVMCRKLALWICKAQMTVLCMSYIKWLVTPLNWMSSVHLLRIDATRLCRNLAGSWPHTWAMASHNASSSMERRFDQNKMYYQITCLLWNYLDKPSASLKIFWL